MPPLSASASPAPTPSPSTNGKDEAIDSSHMNKLIQANSASIAKLKADLDRQVKAGMGLDELMSKLACDYEKFRDTQLHNFEAFTDSTSIKLESVAKSFPDVTDLTAKLYEDHEDIKALKNDVVISRGDMIVLKDEMKQLKNRVAAVEAEVAKLRVQANFETELATIRQNTATSPVFDTPTVPVSVATSTATAVQAVQHQTGPTTTQLLSMFAYMSNTLNKFLLVEQSRQNDATLESKKIDAVCDSFFDMTDHIASLGITLPCVDKPAPAVTTMCNGVDLLNPDDVATAEAAQPTPIPLETGEIPQDATDDDESACQINKKRRSRSEEPSANNSKRQKA